LADDHTAFKKKELPGFCCKQLHGWNGTKEMPGKWLSIVVQTRIFRWLRFRHLFLFLVVQNTHTHIKNILQCQIPKKKSLEYIVQWKILRFQNTLSQRKLVYLTVRFERVSVW